MIRNDRFICRMIKSRPELKCDGRVIVSEANKLRYLKIYAISYCL